MSLPVTPKTAFGTGSYSGMHIPDPRRRHMSHECLKACINAQRRMYVDKHAKALRCPSQQPEHYCCQCASQDWRGDSLLAHLL